MRVGDLKVRPMYTSSAITESQETSEPLNRGTPLFGRAISRNRAVCQTSGPCTERAGCSASPAHVWTCLSSRPRDSLAGRSHRKTKIKRIVGETTSVWRALREFNYVTPVKWGPIYGAPYFVGDSGTGVSFSIGPSRRFERRVSSFRHVGMFFRNEECVCELPDNRRGVTDNRFRSTP